MSLFLGSSQCFGTTWQEAYYPEDLPRDWRLDYYANDYSVVLLPSGNWLQEGLQNLEWPEGLQLIVEVGLEDMRSEYWSEIQSSLQNQPMIRAVAVSDAAAQQTLEAVGIKAKFWDTLSDDKKLIQLSEELNVIHLKTPEAVDLRWIRQQLEQLDPGSETWLFLDAGPAVLAQVKIMVDLMGI